jgi:hypothetical protein
MIYRIRGFSELKYHKMKFVKKKAQHDLTKVARPNKDNYSFSLVRYLNGTDCHSP